MYLDSQTLYALSSLSLLGVAILVAIAAHSYPEELRWSGNLWAGATIAESVGMAAIAARGVIPDGLSVVMAHGFAIGGLAGYHHALERFQGSRVNPLILYAAVPAASLASAYFLFVVPSFSVRVAIFSALAALELGLCSWASWRARRLAPLTSRLATVGFGMVGVLVACRVVLSLGLSPDAPPQAIFRPSVPEQLIIVSVMLLFFLLAFAFVMLCNERISNELRRQALVDPLTGYANRRGIHQAGQREVSRANRKNLVVSVALVDLDNLKIMNDEEGHAFGDLALRHVAECLNQVLRGVDLFGRWGGDEFLVVLPDTDLEGARLACERVRSQVAGSSLGHAPKQRSYTATIGVTSHLGGSLDFEALVHAADEALYAAKAAGRNCVVAAPAVTIKGRG